MKQIRILVIDTVVFDLNGIAAVILNYGRYLEDHNVHMDYVVINDPLPELKEILKEEKSNVFVLSRRKAPVSYMVKLFHIMKKNKYDMIHVHGNSSTMVIENGIGKIAGIPVRIAHSHNTTCTHLQLHDMLYPFFDRVYTHGFACSEAAGKWLFRKKNFKVIPNGIDLKKFGFSQSVREECRRYLGVGHSILIGHVGNFVDQKNHIFLLDFFEKLLKICPNCYLMLIGIGNLEQKMKQKAKQQGIEERVLFLGRRSDVYRYLQAMDLFVLPSLYEGLPLSLVEAQAAGLPCLVSDHVSREADLTGLIKFLPVDDVNVWVEETERFRPDMEYRRINIEKYHEQISKAGYDIQENGRQMGRIYRECLRGIIEKHTAP